MDKVIVFGRGKYYKKKEENLLTTYEIVAFLDNKKDLSRNGESNAPVFLPAQLDTLPKVPIFVMVSNTYIFDVVKQLLDLKVETERIRLGLCLAPFLTDTERWLADNKVDVSVCDDGITLKYKDFDWVVNCIDDLIKAIRDINREVNPYINILSKMPTQPINKQWGHPFGRPIDRRYIEDFLQNNSFYITGDVAEIADNSYTQKFGHDLSNTYTLHVYGIDNTIKCNLATGEGVVENFCDCLICTQTLQFIFDLHNTVKNIYRILKPNGTALITVPGISQIDMFCYRRWGESWRFTEQSLKALFEEYFDKEKITVASFGNVKTATCFLYGMCQEDLHEDDYIFNDEMYPVILTLVCHK